MSWSTKTVSRRDAEDTEKHTSWWLFSAYSASPREILADASRRLADPRRILRPVNRGRPVLPQARRPQCRRLFSGRSQSPLVGHRAFGFGCLHRRRPGFSHGVFPERLQRALADGLGHVVDLDAPSRRAVGAHVAAAGRGYQRRADRAALWRPRGPALPERLRGLRVPGLGADGAGVCRGMDGGDARAHPGLVRRPSAGCVWRGHHRLLDGVRILRRGVQRRDPVLPADGGKRRVRNDAACQSRRPHPGVEQNRRATRRGIS